jgi:hypothetical protein
MHKPMYDPLYVLRELPLPLSMWPCIETLDEVEPSNPVDSLEDWCDHEKLRAFLGPWGALEQFNKHSENIFIDCSWFLIG